MKTLSIVIPAYNEERTIAALIEKVRAVDTESLGFKKELIVVDDGSKDQTSARASAYDGVRVLRQTPNQGKGRAVQRGMRAATGDYILIQDADLEYDPQDYLPMLRKVAAGSEVVYGSRTLGQARQQKGFTLCPGRHPRQSFGPWLAGALLSFWTAFLYGRWITDTLTAYKLYPAPAVQGMHLMTAGFETDHEITARLILQGLPIAEVPIEYTPRSAEEGKKIKAVDGLIAVWTLLRFRF